MEPTEITRTTRSPGDLAALIPEWRRALMAPPKPRAPRTVEGYTESAIRLLDFLVAAGMPTEATSITREHIETFLGSLAERGNAPATVSVHFRALQQFWKWALEEGEVERSPMERIARPEIPERLVPILSKADLATLVKACSGKRFEDVHDLAIISLFIDTGMRRGELTGLTLRTLNRDFAIATVIGKGNRERACPYGPSTAKALDRYVRARARHRLGGLDALWLGPKGALTDSGIAQIVRRRGRLAGIGAIHCHQFRHTTTHHDLADGMSEGDVMRLRGWKSRAMLARYGASAADARAHEAFRRTTGLTDRL